MKALSPAIIWFRNDLRLSDNPALAAAAKLKVPLILVYIADEDNVPWSMGAASRWWAHQSLIDLQASLLKQFGARLILRKGSPQAVLDELCHKTGATHILWNRVFEPFHLNQDQLIEKFFSKKSITLSPFNGSLLNNPWDYRNQSGSFFKVFTPFWKKLRTLSIRSLYPTPQTLMLNTLPLHSLTIDELYPLPSPPWYQSLEGLWEVGEKSAKAKLQHFLKNKVTHYSEGRDRPDLNQTSLLSPHLHFGEIGPVQVWHAAHQKMSDTPSLSTNIEKFLSELAWREFSYQLLYHFPELPNKAFKTEFAKFGWKTNSKFLTAWQKGQTGYPIVDAGMRELWQTGYMHNRVRMICASFLIKHLLQPWQAGEAWFWDTLVDADLANNAASWQWVAGSGADAAPYFRIFNPILQGKKFDPKGDYVKQWLPELKDVPIQYIHTPWEAPTKIKSYPQPLIEHEKGRHQALKAYKDLKQ